MPTKPSGLGKVVLMNKLQLVLAIAFGATLMACGQSTPTETNTSPAVLEESLASADLAADDSQELADTLGFSESSAVGFSTGVTVQNIGLLALPSGCRSVTAGSLSTDTDADGIPDNVTVSFDKTNCLRNLPGGSTITRGGSKTLADTSNSNDRNHSETLTNLETIWTRTINGKSVVWTTSRNGSRNITQGTSTTLSRVHDMAGSSVRSVDGSNGVGIAWTNQLTFAYTADAGGTISNNAQLPNGTVVLSGNWKSTRGIRAERNFSASSSGLVYSNRATCASNRLTAGSISFEDSKTKIMITFQGCGIAPAISNTPKP